MPTPTPSPAPVTTAPASLKTILTDITVGLATIATLGEAVLAALPSGPLTVGLQIALPVLTAIVAGLRKLGG